LTENYRQVSPLSSVERFKCPAEGEVNWFWFGIFTGFQWVSSVPQVALSDFFNACFLWVKTASRHHRQHFIELGGIEGFAPSCFVGVCRTSAG
jgi:hypothetical protein